MVLTLKAEVNGEVLFCAEATRIEYTGDSESIAAKYAEEHAVNDEYSLKVSTPSRPIPFKIPGVLTSCKACGSPALVSRIVENLIGNGHLDCEQGVTGEDRDDELEDPFPFPETDDDPKVCYDEACCHSKACCEDCPELN